MTDTRSDSSLGIECAVLGCLLLWHKELYTQLQQIDEADFSIEDCKEVFRVLRSAPEGTDRVVIAERLTPEQRQTLYPAARERAEMAGIANFPDLMICLLQTAQSRRLREEVTRLMFEPMIAVEDLAAVVDREQPRARAFAGTDTAGHNVEAFMQNVGKPQPRIDTGFYDVDSITGGLRVPSVSIIGAYPSTGKTALALNIALRLDDPVLFFSLEMSAHMIFERVASCVADINYQRFSNQTLTEQEVERARRAVREASRSLRVFDDIFEVERQASIIASEKPVLVVVDYLQKVRTVGKSVDRRNEIEYISGMYKQLALRNQCHVMLLSQLKRGENRSAVPCMADLKESGALEADGDCVMLLHRPNVADKTKDRTETTLLIDKNKFGGTGGVSLCFRGEYQRFTSLDRQHHNAPPLPPPPPVNADFIEIGGDLPW